MRRVREPTTLQMARSVLCLAETRGGGEVAPTTFPCPGPSEPSATIHAHSALGLLSTN